MVERELRNKGRVLLAIEWGKIRAIAVVNLGRVHVGSAHGARYR